MKAETLTLQITAKPTLLNKEMAIGFAFGLVASALALLPPQGVLLGAIIGATIGGLIGQWRMQRELNNGKRVGMPTFWNKDTTLGGLLGWIMVTGALGVSLAAVLAATNPVLLSSDITSAQIPGLLESTFGVSANAVGMVTTAMLAGGALSGAYLGGKSGELNMQLEYALAQQQFAAAHSQDVARGKAPEVSYSVEHSKEWAKNVLEEKEQSANKGKEIS